MSDKKTMSFLNFVHLIGHLCNTLLVQGGLKEEQVDFFFGDGLVNRFRLYSMNLIVPRNARYLQDVKPSTTFVGETGQVSTITRDSYTDEQRSLNAKALAWEKICGVTLSKGFTIYNGNVDIVFNNTFTFTPEEKARFLNGEEVKAMHLEGLYTFLGLWFATPKKEEGQKKAQFKLTWTEVPTTEPYYILTIKGLTPRQQWR